MISTTPVKQKYLLSGHGRSGTHYMAELFRALGVDIGTKWHGRDGMSHHFPFQLIPWPYSSWRERYEHLIHYVRDPVRVVESTHYYRDESLRTIVEENASKIDGIIGSWSPLESIVRSVVLWNRVISEAGPSITVRVEDAPGVCKEWLISIGEKIESRGSLPTTSVNHGLDYDRGKVPWGDVSNEAMDMLNSHCALYGYEKTNGRTATR